MNKTNYPGPSGRQKHRLPVTGMLTAILLMIAATGCTDYADTGNRLPEGKYPITFSAAVDELTATRATTDNTWTGTEEVAIKIGSDVKRYKAASDGCLTVEDNQEPFYWTNQTMSVSAWYSSTYSDTKPATFSVQTEQQENDSYQKSDFLYAAQDIIFQSGGSSSMLTFKHLPVKVVVNLKYGDQVTEQEVSNATVSIVNQATTSGTIANDGTVAQVNPDNTTITPNVLTPAPPGYQKSVQALLVPQQMKDKQFIKVSITTNGVERKYFYTPTGDNDANLTAGQQYTYNITVTKEGLQVEPVIALWADSAEDGDATEADTFKIHLASFTPPSNTSDFTVTGAEGATMTASDGVYTTTSNEISISLSAEENYRLKKFLPQVTGSCKLKGSYTVNTRTYTYTFYDIRSDLCLDVIAEAEAAGAKLGNPEVGDYYYVDGTWSSTWEKPCIGIVFKVGASGDDSVSNYNNNDNNDNKLTGTIHGYVVALHDALATAGNWGTRGIETTLTNVDNENETAYTGYSDTKTIISSYSNGNTWKDYQAFSAVVDYRSIVPAPGASSGWYLPSLAQLGDVYSALNSISIPLTTAGQGFTTSASTDYGWYWTSSEKTNSGYDAWHVSFRDNGKKASNAKDGTNYDSGKRACYARAILTF